MTLLDKIERKIGRYAIPNITLFLVMAQSFAWILSKAQPAFVSRLYLQGDLVVKGDYWRLITFVIMPPSENPLFAFFALYFFYLMGSALEGYWGEFRYNLFLLVGYLSAIAAAFIEPHLPATDAFIGGSVFLAFAYLYPNFVIYLFLILPVKIKWVALATWIGYAIIFLSGNGETRLLLIASIFNFLLFFGKPLFLRMRYGVRHMSAQSQELADRNKPFHVCAECGITDKTHRTMDFRYCPDCYGTPGYCEAHIHNHVHRKPPS